MIYPYHTWAPDLLLYSYQSFNLIQEIRSGAEYYDSLMFPHYNIDWLFVHIKGIYKEMS